MNARGRTMDKWHLILLLSTFTQCCFAAGILYPQQSESRELLSLDGIWKFCLFPGEISDVEFNDEFLSSENVEVCSNLYYI